MDHCGHTVTETVRLGRLGGRPPGAIDSIQTLNSRISHSLKPELRLNALAITLCDCLPFVRQSLKATRFFEWNLNLICLLPGVWLDL